MNKTKRSIVVCLLAAALLVSMVGMASAGSSTTWCLSLNSTSILNGADYWMDREARTQTGYLDINDGGSYLWIANEPSQVDCTFCGASDWEVHFDYNTGGGGCPGYLQLSETVNVTIGIFDPDTEIFTEKGYNTDTGSSDAEPCDDGNGASHMFIDTPTFTVPVGDYIAVRVNMSGGDGIRVDLTGASAGTVIASPECSCDYPVPELPTIILMSAGLLALAGFVLYSRSRRRNGKAQ